MAAIRDEARPINIATRTLPERGPSPQDVVGWCCTRTTDVAAKVKEDSAGLEKEYYRVN